MFDELAEWLVIKHYQAAFSSATGLSLGIVPYGALQSDHGSGWGVLKATFCGLVRIPGSRLGCLAGSQNDPNGAAQPPDPQAIICPAGLTHARVPVMVDGRPVAALLSEPVFDRSHTERDFQMAIKKFKGRHGSDWEKNARAAYFRTPVVTSERLRAVIHLLNVFSQYLTDHASRRVRPMADTESKAVTGAKLFIQSHLHEAVTLELVAQHVHVSRFYFCKLFKKTTGMTLTEYVGHVRVEQAKSLLTNSSLRISEVAYAAGFGSIPRFNSVFKRRVEMSPTEFRAAISVP